MLLVLAQPFISQPNLTSVSKTFFGRPSPFSIRSDGLNQRFRETFNESLVFGLIFYTETSFHFDTCAVARERSSVVQCFACLFTLPSSAESAEAESRADEESDVVDPRSTSKTRVKCEYCR